MYFIISSGHTSPFSSSLYFLEISYRQAEVLCSSCLRGDLIGPSGNVVVSFMRYSIDRASLTIHTSTDFLIVPLDWPSCFAFEV
jgi:hypothetical protein